MSLTHTYNETTGPGAVHMRHGLEDRDLFQDISSGKIVDLTALDRWSDQELMQSGLPREMILQIRPALEAIFKGLEKIGAANDQHDFDQKRQDMKREEEKHKEEERFEAVERWNMEDTELGGFAMTNKQALEAEHYNADHFDEIWDRLERDGKVKSSDKAEVKEGLQKDIQIREREKAGEVITGSEKNTIRENKALQSFMNNSLKIEGYRPDAIPTHPDIDSSSSQLNGPKSIQAESPKQTSSGYEIFSVDNLKIQFDNSAKATQSEKPGFVPEDVKKLQQNASASVKKLDAF